MSASHYGDDSYVQKSGVFPFSCYFDLVVVVFVQAIIFAIVLLLFKFKVTNIIPTIVIASNLYLLLVGTSMSAPIVAGVVAR